MSGPACRRASGRASAAMSVLLSSPLLWRRSVRPPRETVTGRAGRGQQHERCGRRLCGRRRPTAGSAAPPCHRAGRAGQQTRADHGLGSGGHAGVSCLVSRTAEMAFIVCTAIGRPQGNPTAMKATPEPNSTPAGTSPATIIVPIACGMKVPRSAQQPLDSPSKLRFVRGSTGFRSAIRQSCRGRADLARVGNRAPNGTCMPFSISATGRKGRIKLCRECRQRAAIAGTFSAGVRALHLCRARCGGWPRRTCSIRSRPPR